jgi:iron complex transport system substrate-binding protein
MTDLRIVSLIASGTEIVFALGLGDKLVGRSHECDYPASVLNLPAVSKPNIDIGASSAAIDKQVKDLKQKALSVYQINTALLKKLQPTHIITQSQCEVCAVSLTDVEEAVCDLVGDRVEIISLEPNCLADVYKDIQKTATILGVELRGKHLVDSLNDKIEAISRKTAKFESKPSVACLEWIEPLMAAGNWVPELIDIAGGIDIWGQSGHKTPAAAESIWHDLQAADPDIIIAMPCGYGIDRTIEDMEKMKSTDGWTKLSAVRSNRVYIADGNQYFNRPGPRLLDSAEILAEIFYPEYFDFGFKTFGWIKYNTN